MVANEVVCGSGVKQRAERTLRASDVKADEDPSRAAVRGGGIEVCVKHEGGGARRTGCHLSGNVDRVRDDARNQVAGLLHVVAHGHLALPKGEEGRTHAQLVLRRLVRESEVTLENLQSGERVSVDNELAKGPFLGRSEEARQQKIDSRSRHFDHPRSDGDIDLAELWHSEWCKGSGYGRYREDGTSGDRGGTKEVVQVSIRSTRVHGHQTDMIIFRFEDGTKKMVQVPIRSTLVPGDPIDQRSRSRSIWCNHFVNAE
ncbi:unnamed protein product [Phytophthora fragariaefolia]|uniref:Unnamed protein product n=1 Tax=Phytophthora fragariaefolia TaxID=1490495 RepID=A0A9W6Y483_9STRA|nr:unnamed protein product [Phytophthora fragariaefolia]